MINWLTFDDVSEQSHMLQGFDQMYRQIGPGRFSGAFGSGVYRDGVAIHIEIANRAMLQQGTVPKGSVGVGLILSKSDPCALNGFHLDQQSAVLLPSGAEFDARYSGSTRFLLITVPLATIQKTIGSELLNKALPLKLEARSSERRRFVSWADSTHQQSRANLPSRMLIDSLLDRIGWHSVQPKVVRSNAKDNYKLYCRVRDWISENLHNQISMDIMSREIGASRRSIEYCLKSITGESPQCYIRLLRLNDTKERLKQAPTGNSANITSIALQSGFNHLGRFSKEYKTLFGELPSSALTRYAICSGPSIQSSVT
jgi:AraC family ethanolamine operon transcriptional activator